MKPYISFKYLILLILSLMVYQSKASEPDSLQKQESGIDLYAIGGLRITAGSISTTWGSNFDNGPVISLGLEIPFTSSHIFALQLYGHTWISKYIGNNPVNAFGYEYAKVSNDYYSLMSLSMYIKYYLYSPSKKISFSLHLCFLFLSQNRSKTGTDYGIGLHYKLSSDVSIGVIRNNHLGPLLNSGASREFPDYWMLEFSYKLF